jgi:NAD(P)H-flavin reductase
VESLRVFWRPCEGVPKNFNNCKLHIMALRRPLALVIAAALSTLVFQALPKSVANLYTERSGAPACSSDASLTWLAGVAVSALLPFLLWRTSTPTAAPGRSRVLGARDQRRTAFWVFSCLNTAWFGLALLSGYMWRETQLGDFASALNFVGGKAAWPALWNLAIIIVPVDRSSYLLRMLGLGHDATLTCHIWAGHALWWWLVAHTALLTIGYAIQYPSIEKWMAVMVPLEDRFTEAPVNFAGWLALLCLALVWLSSLKALRTRSFTAFALLHVLSVPFVLFATLHDYSSLQFAQPGILAWVVDIFLRRKVRQASLLVAPTLQGGDCNRNHGIVQVSPSLGAVSITLPISQACAGALPRPGNFVYIRVSVLAQYEWHPFSLSSVDVERDTITIQIKSLGDWSSKAVTLFTSIASNSSVGGQAVAPLTIEVQGPYGHDLPEALSGHADCLFLAAGAGITGVAATFAERIARGHSRDRLVWCARSQAEVQALGADLQHLPWDVYITGDSGQADVSGHVGAFTLKCAETKRPGSPGSRDFLFLAASIGGLLGMACALVAGRALCCFEPGDTHPQHVCRLAGEPVEECRGCDPSLFNSTLPSPVPCCTLPLCFVCFRGLPAALTFLFTPLGAAIAMWVGERWSRCDQLDRMWRGVNEYVPLLASSASGEADCDAPMLPGADPRPEQHTGRANLHALVAGFAESCSRGGRKCVVVCGPRRFVQAASSAHTAVCAKNSGSKLTFLDVTGGE